MGSQFENRQDGCLTWPWPWRAGPSAGSWTGRGKVWNLCPKLPGSVSGHASKEETVILEVHLPDYLVIASSPMCLPPGESVWFLVPLMTETNVDSEGWGSRGDKVSIWNHTGEYSCCCLAKNPCLLSFKRVAVVVMASLHSSRTLT